MTAQQKRPGVIPDRIEFDFGVNDSSTAWQGETDTRPSIQTTFS